MKIAGRCIGHKGYDEGRANGTATAIVWCGPLLRGGEKFEQTKISGPRPPCFHSWDGYTFEYVEIRVTWLFMHGCKWTTNEGSRNRAGHLPFGLSAGSTRDFGGFSPADLFGTSAVNGTEMIYQIRSSGSD